VGLGGVGGNAGWRGSPENVIIIIRLCNDVKKWVDYADFGDDVINVPPKWWR